MKICATYELDENPKAVEVIDWIKREKVAEESNCHRWMKEERERPDYETRNMVILGREDFVSHYGGPAQPGYRISYELKREYRYIEIESLEELKELLKPLAGIDAGIIFKDDDLWLEYLGE